MILQSGLKVNELWITVVLAMDYTDNDKIQYDFYTVDIQVSD